MLLSELRYRRTHQIIILISVPRAPDFKSPLSIVILHYKLCRQKTALLHICI